MTDLSRLSDSELLAMYAMPALIDQESGGRAGVLGPQTRYGQAQGMTQMLPETAQAMAGKLGVEWRPELMTGTTPEAADYQQRLGEAYLREGIETTGNLQDGLRYYHGGPDRKLWGPKTQAYGDAVLTKLRGAPGAQEQPASDLSGLSDEELMAMYQQPEPVVEAEVVGRPDLGVGQSFKKPPQLKPNDTLGAVKGVIAPYANASRRLGEIDTFNALPESVQGILGPMRALSPGGIAAALLRRAQGGVDTLTDAAAQRGERPGRLGEFAGNVAGASILPGGPLVSGGLSGALLSQGADPLQVAKDAALGAIGGKVAGTALQGAGRALAAPFTRTPKAMTLPQLQAAKNAAYDAVDASGARYKPTAFEGLVRAIDQDVKAANIDALTHPKAFRMMERIKDRLGQSPTLTELDNLRKVVTRDVVNSTDDAEAFFGRMMRDEIDNFVKAAGAKHMVAGDAKAAAGLVRNARDLNTRYAKTKDIEEALYKAENRAATGGTGGNADNAIRQNARKILETTKNLTPDERVALEKIVRGGKVQNAARLVGRLSPQTGGLSAILGTLGTMTNPAIGIPFLAGAVSKPVADQLTKHNVNDLLKLISAGGNRAALAPVVSPAGRVIQKSVPKLRAPVAASGAALAVGANRPKQKSR